MTPPYFCNYLPFEVDLALYLNNLQFSLLTDDLLSLIEIGLLVLEKIFKNCQGMFTQLLLSPLGRGVALHFNNLESSFPKDDLCQVWIKLALWF
jgi:hypothetical protein